MAISSVRSRSQIACRASAAGLGAFQARLDATPDHSPLEPTPSP
jgi:hypothetical protein